MIQTKIIGTEPVIIHHRVSGEVSEPDALRGANEAISVANDIVQNHGKFRLILDMRGYAVSNLRAHKIWSLAFKEQDLVTKNVSKVAIVGDAGPTLAAEKELMETDHMKFFSDLAEARSWITGA